ncbi:MAG: 50S ribosomal protein L1 [Fibrobacteria bacterium]|nr:50S ribosomal protein L1 [Fibrobacteria bacterium]
MKRGKKYQEIAKQIEAGKEYTIPEAVKILKNGKCTSFDSSLEVHINLGVNPKHADQMVRGNVVLPHGTGKKVRVLVFAKGDMVKAAEEAGAEFVGGEELVNKIQEGWLEFDKVVAAPDMMPVIGKIARVLGPRGLMPNPKSGTVTPNVAGAVSELKAGKLSYRVDKGANIHAAVGKLSFSEEQLVDNSKVLIESIIKAKPATSKGEYIKKVAISGTMTPGIVIAKVALR